MAYDINTLFAPKDKSYTREQIWQCFFEPRVDELTEKSVYYCYVDKKQYELSAFYADEIPDALCQEFVEGQYAVEKTVDLAESVYERSIHIKNMFKKIKTAVKKERITIKRAIASAERVTIREAKKLAKQQAKDAKKMKKMAESIAKTSLVKMAAKKTKKKV